VLMDDFERGLADEVYMVYAQFVSTLVQRPVLDKLLPIPRTPVQGLGTRRSYVFEPDRKPLLADLLPRLVELQVAMALREAVASEHSARMVAMREATENAEEMLGYLTRVRNRERQRGITQEVLEVSEGAQFGAISQG